MLRGPRHAGGLGGLATALAEVEDAPELRTWLARIVAAATPLARALAAEPPMAELITLHLGFAEWLAADETGSPVELWAREAGRCAQQFMTGLAEAADAAGDVPASGYPAMLAVLMALGERPTGSPGASPRSRCWARSRGGWPRPISSSWAGSTRASGRPLPRPAPG